jgi:3-hydroxyisobutyrate dehydrogenase-like beta-hydroxyacid dehydrogenase
VVLSLPDGAASEAVCRTLVDRRPPTGPGTADGHGVRAVVDTSTIGVRAAWRIDALLAGAGIAYVDAPVSGGPAGARARTLMVMVAGTDEACAAAAPAIAGLSDRNRRVGDRPGMAQALKLANNFLSATALAATSEAVAFGASVGLDPTTMVEVLDASSGRSSATGDKFPNEVLTGRYASGFANTLMAKDVRLYLEEVAAAEGPTAVGEVTGDVWSRFAADEPGADFTRIYPFVADPP